MNVPFWCFDAVETPDSIPNSAVKRGSGDDTLLGKVARRQDGAFINKNPPEMAGFCYDREMPWSTTRQILFALGALVILIGVSLGVYFSVFYKPASCFDGQQNQDEIGVDCGGSCNLLCEAPNVTALSPRAVRVAPGVYHATALIKNPDTQAQGVVPYEVSLFDSENILITTRKGEIILLPGDLAPLFEANIVTGERVPARAFVDIRNGSFSKTEREASPVRVLSFNLNEESRRLTATIENQTVFPVNDITIIAFLYNDTELRINASQTRVDSLDPRERREIVFTWQEPFSESPTRIDIFPRVIP